MPIEIDGLGDALAEFSNAIALCQSDKPLDVLRELGEQGAALMRSRAPVYAGPPERDVVPGELAAAVFVHPYSYQGAPAVIYGTNGDNVPYASDVEFGTDRQAAEPFGRPSFDEIEQVAEDQVAQALGALLD